MKNKKIKVVYYCGASYDAFLLNHIEARREQLRAADFVVFAPSTVATIDFDKEIKKETKMLHEFASFSKEFSAMVIVLTEIVVGGNAQNVALVFDEGKLLTIIENITHGVGARAVNLIETPHGRLAIFVYSNASQIEFFQLAHAFDASLVFAFPHANEKRAANLCAFYASEKMQLNTLCFENKKIKHYSLKNGSANGQWVISATILLKNPIKMQQFCFFMHKTIYSSRG